MSKQKGTYLIEFFDGDKIICGNNYKTWLEHATEYAWSKYQNNRPHTELVTSVKFSDTPFVDDGGLKWAGTDAYQEVIDEVSKEDGKKRPSFNDIVFSISNRDKKKLEDNIRYWGLI